MDLILLEIDKALKRKGLSDAAASRLAVGHPSLLKNFRIPRGSTKRYNVDALQKLADVLDLEFYFGEPRETEAAPELELDQAVFSVVPRLDGHVAAGDGFINLEGEPVGHLAFTKDWLERTGVLPGSCFLISVRGDSMSPCIADGDLVMIDRRRQQIVDGKVYAFNDGENGTRIKRLEVIPETAIILRSDNVTYEKEHRTGEEMNAIAQAIIGQVVWSSHKW